MGQFRWDTPASEETVMSTELNSITNSSNAISGTISNDASTELDDWVTFDLSLAAQGTARNSTARVELYILYTLDGTNFTFGSASLDPPATAWVADFPFDAATTARTVVLGPILLLPFDFQAVIINETGQTLAASGNTLTMRRHPRQNG